ncbi:MAG: hypothetical protein QM751_00375 [Paludibacteraceae bacterium]
MNNNNQIKNIGNTIEVHYCFNDVTHSMDALVLNKCNYEVLNIIKEVSRLLSVEIIIETEPFGEGGLKTWFKVLTKEEKKKAVILTAVVSSLCTTLFVTPVSKITETVIEKIFEDSELKDLEKEKMELEIEKLKQEINQNSEVINNSVAIRKRKSNFYETLDKYPKVNQVQFILTNENKQSAYKNEIIQKNDFGKFILISDDLEPTEKDEAIIEIISPVLKKGKYKWTGIYNGEKISFNMLSNEFKTLIQNGEVEFKNGFSINCALLTRKKIDNEGSSIIVGYDVTRVNNYFLNDNPIETDEGKRHRKQKEAEKLQLKLFD